MYSKGVLKPFITSAHKYRNCGTKSVAALARAFAVPSHRSMAMLKKWEIECVDVAIGLFTALSKYLDQDCALYQYPIEYRRRYGRYKYWNFHMTSAYISISICQKFQYTSAVLLLTDVLILLKCFTDSKITEDTSHWRLVTILAIVGLVFLPLSRFTQHVRIKSAKLMPKSSRIAGRLSLFDSRYSRKVAWSISSSSSIMFEKGVLNGCLSVGDRHYLPWWAIDQMTRP